MVGSPEPDLEASRRTRRASRYTPMDETSRVIVKATPAMVPAAPAAFPCAFAVITYINPATRADTLSVHPQISNVARILLVDCPIARHMKAIATKRRIGTGGLNPFESFGRVWKTGTLFGNMGIPCHPCYRSLSSLLGRSRPDTTFAYCSSVRLTYSLPRFHALTEWSNPTSVTSLG